jgi:hypothetical protein
MLSSALRSRTASAVNVEIMRASVRLRRASVVSREVVNLVNELAKRVDTHDSAIGHIVETIRRLVGGPLQRKRPIGFTANID